jgi:Flp pilus assembly protein CpaB
VKTTRRRFARPSISGLLATRRGALALALACAAAATGILVIAISSYQHSLRGNTKQDTVLVATTEIQQGTSADVIAAQRLYKVTPVLESQVTQGAIVNAASISGKVVANRILPGQQLTSADFTNGSGVSTELAPTERAVSVTLDQAHGLVSVLQTGDHVDVYGSFAAGTSSSDNVVSLLVSDAVVLKAPGGPGGGLSGSGSAEGNVLLGVSDQLAPRVMWVADYGKVWLELRGADSSNPEPTITGRQQLLLGNQLSTTPTFDSPSAAGSAQ